MINERGYVLKPGWRDDFRAESCAYCLFNCNFEFMEEHDYFCDAFTPCLKGDSRLDM